MIRSEFPIFAAERPLAYLDSAATMQKPRAVIDAVTRYLSEGCANIHRGAYALSAAATEQFEGVREKVTSFLNAGSDMEVVFTRGATESLNLAAFGISQLLSPGECIVLTELEHHSNIVPWQLWAERRGLELCFVRLKNGGVLDLEHYKELLRTRRPRAVSFTGLSNALGTVTPIPAMAALAKEAGAWVVVDGAQAVAHRRLDLSRLDVDLLAFSGHKLYGPTGVGVLVGRRALLDTFPPFLGGGDMIERVTIEGTTYKSAPGRFEAGTPPIAEVIGLGAALDFLARINFEEELAREARLHQYAWEQLSRVEGVTLYGPRMVGEEQAAVLPFNITDVHPHDVATIADASGVQIRSGHHCAMPAHRALGIPSSARASLGIYSLEADIDRLIEALQRARKVFQ